MNDLANWGDGEFRFGLYNIVSKFSILFPGHCSKKKKARIYKKHFLTVLHNAETFVHILMARVPLPVRFTTLFSEPAATPG